MEDYLGMPPGFRFHPTDLEIVVNYLEEKVMNRHFTARAIGEIDLNTCEPWDLPCKAKMGGKEWYFFWQRDRKYPTGSRTNRATESGYWKATGKDKEIYKGKGCLVGMKKTLVFYLGRAPRGQKTGWVMHEYRLEGQSLFQFSRAANDWVVCRVLHKNEQIQKSPQHEVGLWESSNVLPALLDSPPPDNSSSYSNIVDHLVPFSGFYPHHQMLQAEQTQLFQFDSIRTGFTPLHQDNDCKVEQYYETSAVHNTNGKEALVAGNTCCEGPGSPSSSVGPLGDLDNIWSY